MFYMRLNLFIQRNEVIKRKYFIQTKKKLNIHMYICQNHVLQYQHQTIPNAYDLLCRAYG